MFVVQLFSFAKQQFWYVTQSGIGISKQIRYKKKAKLSIFEHIEVWYNQNRRHKQLNNLTIGEFQKSITTNLNHED